MDEHRRCRGCQPKLKDLEAIPFEERTPETWFQIELTRRKKRIVADQKLVDAIIHNRPHPKRMRTLVVDRGLGYSGARHSVTEETGPTEGR